MLGAIAGLAGQACLLAVALGFSRAVQSPENWIDWLTFWSSGLSLSIVAILTAAAIYFSPTGVPRRFWTFITLALGLLLAGSFIENVNYLHGINRVLDTNDIFFIGSKFTILALQAGALRRILGRHSFKALSFDIVAAGSSVFVVLWFLLASSHEASVATMTPREQLAMVFYAIVDVLIIFNFLAIAMRSDDLDSEIDRLTRMIVFLGLFILSAGDLRWEVDKLNARPIMSDSASELLAHIAYITAAFGVLRFSLVVFARPNRRPALPSLLEDIAPFAHILAAVGLIYLIGWDFFQPLGRGLFMAMTFAVVMLLIRQSAAFRTQLELRTKLAITSTEARLANWFRQQGPMGSQIQAPLSTATAALQATLDGPWVGDEERAQLLPAVMAENWTAATAYEIERIKTSNLASAIEQGWFKPWFQPVHDIVTGEVRSFELLARCQHPQLGFLTPAHFIEDIEDAGLSGQLVRSLLPQGLRDIKQLTEIGLIRPDVSLAINVTVGDLEDPLFANDIIDLLKQEEVAPDRLTLELTERMVAEGRLLDIPSAQRLRQLGVKLAIDDFGTGYSSLAYLDRFQPDIVKISQSFIDEIDTRSGLAELVRSIVEMTSRLRIGLIVEGIERTAQIELLRTLGCTLIQGYFFSRPMSFVDLRDLLQKGQDDLG